ncbi:ATP-binding protein [Glaciimonas soli]|uniref:Virulence sensor protein BvgS n=1 Tax=Glaciimonas soli TaxID=2590999 RepID=A0A843YZ48_9BURK|nr:transporter substrate-binding domain-containing protein [Glaciimonas soli]MQR02492.1 transporter substrate-binding domain-containing protein [Glaciimonas soli]
MNPCYASMNGYIHRGGTNVALQQCRLRRFILSLFIWVALFGFSLLSSAQAQTHDVGESTSPQVVNKPVFTPEERAWINAHHDVYISVDPDWRPLEYVENGIHKGLSAEYVSAISKVSGLRFRLLPSNQWEEARQALMDRRVDLLPAISEQFASDKLKNEVIFTEPYFVGSTVIIATSAEPIIFDIRKLNGKVVAIKGGGAYERVLRAHYPEVKVLSVANPEAALQAVVDGRADAALGVDTALRPLLRRKFLGTLHIAGAIGDMPATVSMGVRKDLPVLASIIKKSLASLSSKQTDRMVDTWLEETDYGAPSWGTLLRYYDTEIISLSIAAVFILLFAHRAQVARRLAIKSEQDKSNFLAVMSHEIRTPMNAILSSVELLQRSPLDQRQQEMANVAGSAAESLLSLLDDVLDLSKLEAHRLELELVPTDISVLAQQSVNMMQIKAQEKNLPLGLDVQVPENTDVFIDPTRVRQILLNLLSNAIKFTEYGKVSVIIRLQVDALAAQTDASPQVLHVSVTDTGIGITSEHQSRLFQPFTQADRSTTRRYGGTGLGLTICHELVKVMGGTLALQSAKGAGTTISFTIPVTTKLRSGDNSGDGINSIDSSDDTQLRSHPVRIASDKTAIAETSRLAILVVDDHVNNRLVIGRQLEALGCDAVMVEDGPSALALLAVRTFSLMLLDCYLPGMDGYEIARTIRQQEKNSDRHLPVIAISAAVDKNHEQNCMDSGMDGLLRKPIRLEELKSIIEAWCDVELMVSSYPIYSENSDELFRSNAEQDWGKIQQALIHNDYKTIAHHLHRIKGSAQMTRMSTIVDATKKIEAVLSDEHQPIDVEKLQAACEVLRKRIEQL